jgi:hypothetical protein
MKHKTYYQCCNLDGPKNPFQLVLSSYLPITMEENQHENDSYKKKRRCGWVPWLSQCKNSTYTSLLKCPKPNKGEGDWILWLHEKYIKAPQLWDHYGYSTHSVIHPNFILYFSLFLISNFDWSLPKKKKKKGIHMLCTSIIKYLYYFLLDYPCWLHMASTFIWVCMTFGNDGHHFWPRLCWLGNSTNILLLKTCR